MVPFCLYCVRVLLVLCKRVTEALNGYQERWNRFGFGYSVHCSSSYLILLGWGTIGASNPLYPLVRDE